MTPRQIAGPTGPIRELLRVVSSEANGCREQDLGDDEDLRGMACGAKRLAILLLKGAWAAERAAEALDVGEQAEDVAAGTALSEVS